MSVLTITTTAAQDARFSTAVGKAQGLGRDAAMPECKAFTITLLSQFVQQQEYIAAQNNIVRTPFDPT